MPLYTFSGADGTTTKRKLTFEQYERVLAGTLRVTDDAGQSLAIVFNPAGLAFVLKDGPSGGWMSKANKENGYRAGRSGVMARREKDHVFKTRLIPNLGGQEAANWADVREQVQSTAGALAASTYDSHVAKESTTP